MAAGYYIELNDWRFKMYDKLNGGDIIVYRDCLLHFNSNLTCYAIQFFVGNKIFMGSL